MFDGLRKKLTTALQPVTAKLSPYWSRMQETRFFKYMNARLSVRSQIILGVTCAFALFSFSFLFYVFYSLPSVDELTNYTPSIVSKVYSDDNELIAEFFDERRVVVPYSSIPQHLVKAVLAAEDSKFFEHKGINYLSILRAMYKNTTAGEVKQGASTITQQVAKNILLTPERTYTRKFKEAILAHRIEKHFTKEEILALYLNQVYFGSGAYGVQTAADTYFGKNVDKLDLAESAMLAGLLSRPNVYSPLNNPAIAKSRQEFVLTRMTEEGYITDEAARKAMTKVLTYKPRNENALWVGPYFTEHVRRYVEEKYGADLLYKGGLKIYTTLDIKAQRSANAAVNAGLRELDKRIGYRGAETKLASQEAIDAYVTEAQKALIDTPVAKDKIYKAVIVSLDEAKKTLHVAIGEMKCTIAPRDYSWARNYNPENTPDGAIEVKEPFSLFHVGDVIDVLVLTVPPEKTKVPVLATGSLEQEPLVNGALIAIDSKTGFVKAMVGGKNFYTTQFNRAVQAKRQPGSSFKPFIYAAAIDSNRYTPATTVIDSPMVFDEIKDVVKENESNDKTQTTWKPRNYDGTFLGPVTVRKALAYSRNVVTIKILKDIGVSSVISYARLLGIESPLAEDLSLALGSSAVTLEELTNAYSTIANSGIKNRPIYITKITDKNGVILEENKPAPEQVLNPQTAYIMTSLMQGVVEHGTGWKAKALRRPAAAKTGTTNNLNDAWFMGYVPGLTAGVWVGYDEEKKLGRGETGSSAAAPIWVEFMKETLTSTQPENFKVPEGIEFIKVDPENGLRAAPNSENQLFEAFKTGTAPTEFSVKKNKRNGDFFIDDQDLVSTPEDGSLGAPNENKPTPQESL